MKHQLTVLLLFASFLSFSQAKRLLSLEECIEIAVENNLNIQRSQLNLEGADIDLRQSRWQRYPTLNMSGNYGHSWGRGIDPVTNLFTNREIRFNGVSGFTSVPIINGMQINNTIKQNKVDREASAFDLKKATNDVSLSVSLFYVNVIFNKELVDNARYQLESSREQLVRTKKLVEAGSLALSNQLQQESQLATNEVNLINAQNTLDLALLDLKQALLLPPGEDVDIVVPEVDVDASEIDTMTIVDIFNKALSTQPEIEAAELRVNSAELGVKVSKGALYPSLDLSGQLSTNYSNAANTISFDSLTTAPVETDFFVGSTGDEIYENKTFFDVRAEQTPFTRQYKDNYSRRLTLGLSIPILNGMRASSNVQRAKINLQQAEISVVEQRNILYQSIESAFRNAKAASKTYEARQKQVASLEETFRTVENQYNLGASNFTDYQVANNNLYQAQTDLSRAKFDFIYRQKILEFYLGLPLSF